MVRTGRCFLATIAVAFCANAAIGEILNFTTTIDGAQANSCVGTGSAGTGSGTLTLDTDTGQVNYNIVFSGLTGTETAAHVHGAAAECANAGVAYGLPAGSPKIGTTTITSGQQASMIAGQHYVNIHSTVDPGGEIRGQILLVERAVPAVSQWGLIVMGLVMVVAATVVYCRRQSATA